jgi:hypothetical protein
MTVNAIARLSDMSIGPADNEVSPDDHYHLTVNYVVTNGTTAQSASQQGVIFPVSWGVKRGNRYIREQVAASILQIHSLTIDPEDIYFPLF